MKAQSAIEYLMTYGWMLLVVALVGGLLFALFQDQELESQTVEGFEDEDVRVEEVTAGNDSVQLSLRSYDEEGMESVKLCLNNSQLGGKCSSSFDLIRLGDRVVDLNGFNQTDESYSYDVSVSYETTGGISDTVSGTVSLSVKPERSDDSGEDGKPSDSASLSVRNTGDNISEGVSPDGSVKIYSEFNSSGSGLDSGWLATNESGVWENKTGNYKNDLSGEDVWVWNNFTWSNSSVSSETVGWRLYTNNSDGLVKSSSAITFEVGSGISAPNVDVLEPVVVNTGNATLRGNVTSLGGAGSVDVSFNVTSNSSIGLLNSNDSFDSTGVFEEDVTGLEPDTSYNYTALASNSAGENLTSKKEFSTSMILVDGFEDGGAKDDWSEGIEGYRSGGFSTWIASTAYSKSGSYSLKISGNNKRGISTNIAHSSVNEFSFEVREENEPSDDFGVWLLDGNDNIIINIDLRREVYGGDVHFGNSNGLQVDTGYNLDNGEWHKIRIYNITLGESYNYSITDSTGTVVRQGSIDETANPSNLSLIGIHGTSSSREYYFDDIKIE